MNRLEFAYLDEGDMSVNRDMVRSDTQFIALDAVAQRPVEGRRIWIGWEGWADPFTRQVSTDPVEGWREYVEFSAVTDSAVVYERCWYSRKHKQNVEGGSGYYNWKEGEDPYAGHPAYATTGYDIITGAGELITGEPGYSMVHSRGDRVHSVEEVQNWADSGGVSLTKYHMAERDLAFNPTHAMRAAFDAVEKVFYS